LADSDQLPGVISGANEANPPVREGEAPAEPVGFWLERNQFQSTATGANEANIAVGSYGTFG